MEEKEEEEGTHRSEIEKGNEHFYLFPGQLLLHSSLPNKQNRDCLFCELGLANRSITSPIEKLIQRNVVLNRWNQRRRFCRIY